LAPALEHLRRDECLRPLLDAVGGAARISLKPSPGPTPLHSLAEAIMGQQLNGRAAAAIFERFLALFGGKPTADAILGIDESELRSIGLSRAKAAAVRDLAEKAKSGAVPGWKALRLMDDEAIVQCLTQVRGIGRWTAEMMLIFALGRPDVWPVGDFAIRRAYGRLFGAAEPKAAEMLRRAEAWRPWRSVVAMYLWKSLDIGGKSGG
jgi:3-methyladenine DNA glycosylase/8-oxoguanine DNA glycosylase